ncbi:MAG: T9SS type A sorting domain-containing protein, partial [Candidatus Hydrothermae bacterium]|nr:T9SS type A sorting domain-containing protein [Candidatus Hydrothermae bacterium]
LEISVENMRNGVYFLRLETDRGSVTRKLIVR